MDLPGFGARLRALASPPALPIAVGYLLVKQLGVLAALISGVKLNLAFNTAVTCAGAALLIVPAVMLLRGRAQLAAAFLADLVLTFVLHVDLLYYRQMLDLPSWGVLRFLGLAGEVHGAITHLLSPLDALLWLDVAALLVLSVAAPASLRARLPPLGFRRVVGLGATGLALIVAGGAASKYVRKPHGGHIAVASRLGLVGYHLYDGSTYSVRGLRKAFPSQEAIAEAEARFREPLPAPSPLAGAAAGKNVLVVQLESFQAFPADLTFGGKPVTPFLHELAKESVTFDGYYAQVGLGTTSDAELASLCSLYPSGSGSIYYDHAGNDFRCLPELLRSRGYGTYAFHANRPDYWNRSAIYPQLGFDRFFAEKDFVLDEVLGMGLSDASFYRQVLDRLEQAEEPWLGFAISLTNHSPFDDPRLPRDLELGALEGTFTGHFLHSSRYADHALRLLVEDLRRRGMLEKTVLVVYGDHQGVGRGNSDVARELPGPPLDDGAAWLDFERRVPMLVRLPHGAGAGKRPWVGAQIDLTPTLLALLGHPEDARLSIGRDLLSGPDRLVAFPNGTAIGGGLVYLSPDAGGKHRCVRLADRAPQPGEACAPLAERAQRELRVSRSVVDSDLVPHLVGALRPPAPAPDLRVAQDPG